MAITHPVTGNDISLQPGERLARIVWPGHLVLVITRTNDDGEEVYRLAVPHCQVWNRVYPLTLEPWSPATDS